MRTNKLKLKQKEKRTKDEKQKGKCIISKKNLLDASLLLVADRTVTDQLEGRMSKKSQEKPRLISRIYPWWKQQSVSQWVTATPERWWLVSELPKRHWTTLKDTERHWTGSLKHKTYRPRYSTLVEQTLSIGEFWPSGLN